MSRTLDRKVEQARAARRREVARLDTQIANLRESIDALLDEVRAKENARAELAALDAARPAREHAPRSSRRIAGPKAIALVARTLQGVGRTTQAEIVKATGKNSGTVTHALRVLEDEGLARRTGRRERASDEWAWMGNTKDLARLVEKRAA